MSKPKVGFYWCASCGGCDEAVVDLAENILPVVEAVDIAVWPVAMDFKRSDVEDMQDGEMVVTFINGAIRNSEDREIVEILREKSKYIVAFGSCAHLGGVPGMGNLCTRESILECSYSETPSSVNPEKVCPQGEIKVPEGVLTLPVLNERVLTLDQTIPVDYYLPGCPPPVALIVDGVTAFLTNQLPPKGSVLGPKHSLCLDCPRKDTKPENMLIKEFKRPHETEIDLETCLLAQGLLCLGPATRSGCGAACINGNMPCTGCLGPTDQVKDYGAKALSGIASLFEAETDAEIARMADRIVDPAGTFYRYSLPGSLFQGKVFQKEGARS
ncbi:MAG TPA: oxidoreductase [bacterium]|nr:oxidoreductase [bacterium]